MTVDIFRNVKHPDHDPKDCDCICDGCIKAIQKYVKRLGKTL